MPYGRRRSSRDAGMAGEAFAGVGFRIGGRAVALIPVAGVGDSIRRDFVDVPMVVVVFQEGVAG